jgi:DNA-binding XRE family transcriptional regulator
MVKKKKLTPPKKDPKWRKAFNAKGERKPPVNSEMSPKQFLTWRNSMGLSQNGAAELLGFKHRSSICHIEKGKKAITPQIAMLCRMFQENAR